MSTIQEDQFIANIPKLTADQRKNAEKLIIKHIVYLEKIIKVETPANRIELQKELDRDRARLVNLMALNNEEGTDNE